MVQVQQGEPKRRAGQKTCFFSLPALPQRLMSVHLPLADFNLGRSRPPPVADAGRRRWSKTRRARKGIYPWPRATMFWFVWSLLIDVCNLIIWLKLNYIVGLSPTRRAKTKGHPDWCPFCFCFIYSIWTTALWMSFCFSFVYSIWLTATGYPCIILIAVIV